MLIKKTSDHLLPILIVGLLLLTIEMNGLPSSTYHKDTGIENKNFYHISHNLQQQVTFGYDRTLSVLYWFGVISNFGEKSAQHIDEDYAALAERLDTITTLNPYAEPAYFMAALVLPWQLQSTTLSRPLLKKAMRAMPDKWIWPYYYAFNAYWFDHDMEQAARYMTHAASLPKAPLTVIHVASKMSAEANNLDAAITFLQQLLNNEQQDESLRDVLHQRIAAIKTEKVLRLIENDLMAVPGWKGDMDRLSDLGIHIPFQLPDGGIVIFDKQYRPMSSKQPHRFKLFVPSRLNKESKKHE